MKGRFGFCLTLAVSLCGTPFPLPRAHTRLSRMEKAKITPQVLQFLKSLKENNSRDWFEAHKPEFKKVEATAKNFFAGITEALRTHDDIEGMKLFRIYRDVRFSSDKTPYNPHFAGSFQRAGARLRGGYYLRIRPGESFIAAGFWQPSPPDLLRIRRELELDAGFFRNCLNDPALKKVWGPIKGETVLTAPKGFDRSDPNLDLIRHKQFLFTREFSDEQVMSPDFLPVVNNSFIAIRPWFDLMSEILTTDLNGRSLLD